MSDVTIPEDIRRDAITALDAYRAATGVSLLVSFEDQVGAVALAILAERQRQMPGAIELYRILKANRKRKYADIAKLIAAHIGGAP